MISEYTSAWGYPKRGPTLEKNRKKSIFIGYRFLTLKHEKWVQNHNKLFFMALDAKLKVIPHPDDLYRYFSFFSIVG